MSCDKRLPFYLEQSLPDASGLMAPFDCRRNRYVPLAKSMKRTSEFRERDT